MRRRHFLVGLCGIPFQGIARKALDQTQAGEQAVRFLTQQQQTDGCWKSEIYGAFKDGHGLTPLITLALLENGSPQAVVAAGRALRWLTQHQETLGKVFPVHQASWLLQAGLHDEAFVLFRPAMVERLRELHFGSTQGWTPKQSAFGGWGYAPQPPTLDAPFAPFQQPNLAATVLAVDGLRSAGVPTSDLVLRECLTFIKRCQNLRNHPGIECGTFDDGGFFQMAEDPSRNKAGVAGTDQLGRRRLRSYTSATADGLRGLLRCGMPPTATRVEAARRWLARHADCHDVPDLRYFSALTMASTTGTLPEDSIAALIQLQSTHGFWRNAAGEMREDDPLVATAMMVLALARSRSSSGL